MINWQQTIELMKTAIMRVKDCAVSLQLFNSANTYAHQCTPTESHASSDHTLSQSQENHPQHSNPITPTLLHTYFSSPTCPTNAHPGVPYNPIPSSRLTLSTESIAPKLTHTHAAVLYPSHTHSSRSTLLTPPIPSTLTRTYRINPTQMLLVIIDLWPEFWLAWAEEHQIFSRTVPFFQNFQKKECSICRSLKSRVNLILIAYYLLRISSLAFAWFEETIIENNFIPDKSLHRRW